MHHLEVFGWNPKDPAEGRIYSYPAAWAECTVLQLGTVAALTSAKPDLQSAEIQELPPAEQARMAEMGEAHLRLHLLRELTGMAGQVFEQIDVSDLLSLRPDDLGVERVAFLPSLDWCMVEPIYDKSLVPELVVGKRRFAGPNERLARMTVLQWGFADTLMGVFVKSGQVQDLNMVLGALYHDHGTPWNSELEERAEVLATVDDRTKLAAILNYRALRSWLAKRYPRSHRGGKADPHGVQGMIVELGGPKFGTVDQVRSADLHDVMIHCEKSLIMKEEMERNANRK